LKDKTTETEGEQEPTYSAKFSKQPSLPSESESDLSSSPYQEPENKDEDFIPSETPESESTPASSETDAGKSSMENKDDFYIISWTHLLMLLQLWACKCCGEKQQHIQRVTRGTMLQVVFVCSRCSNQSKWNSQGYTGNIPTGNILLSSAIMASGALATQCLKIFQHMKVASISPRTFFRQQQLYILPSIRKVWNHTQTWLLATLQAEQRDLVLGGDGRADSPGHSAKYGCYTFLEMKANVIIDTRLVQVHVT